MVACVIPMDISTEKHQRKSFKTTKAWELANWLALIYIAVKEKPLLINIDTSLIFAAKIIHTMLV